MCRESWVPEAVTNVGPALKTEVYADLRLRMIYRLAEELLLVSATPCVLQRVSEGRNKHLRTRDSWQAWLVVACEQSCVAEPGKCASALVP